jgi:hypothetical protein
MPEPEMKPYAYPKGHAFIGIPDRPFKPIGRVRSKVDYASLDMVHEEGQLCRNYFNKAARDLVVQAKKAGGDAVVGVRSVVYLVDGRVEGYEKAECSDDGDEGQALAEGVAVKWVDAQKNPEDAKPVPESWLTPLKPQPKIPNP